MSINTVSTEDRAIVEGYLASMQAGPAGLDKLVAMFDDQAVYIEPFNGQLQAHHGKQEIRKFFEVALSQHLHNVRLTLDRLDIDGGRLRSEWTCYLSGMPAPMRGFDLLDVRAGRIVRLETTVTEFPQMPQR